MDESLYRAYLATHFHIDTEPRTVVRIGVPATEFAEWMKAQGYRKAVLVTAWNPYSVPLDQGENLKRQLELETEAASLGLKALHSRGADPTGEWQAEESLCLFDVSPEQRDAWMRRYEQNAVVQIDAEGNVNLYWHPDLHSYKDECPPEGGHSEEQ